MKVCVRKSSIILATLLLLRMNIRADEIALPLSWIIQGQSFEVLSYIDTESDSLTGADKKNLQEILDHRLEDNSFLHKQAEIPVLSLEELLDSGISVEFKPAELLVLISIPVHLQKLQNLSLTYQPGQTTSELLQPDSLSVYLNLYGYHNINSESPATHRFSTESSVNLKDWVLFNRSSWDSSSDFSEPELSLIHDFSGPLLRLEAGHFRPGAQGFQQSGTYQGVSLKRFRSMDSEKRQNFSSGKSFFLEEDARVEVWVNYRQVQILNLQAGRYNLQDFPFYSGINRIDLEITEASGRQRSLSFYQSHSRNLLAEGVMDFHLSAGVSPWSGEEWLLTANQQYGVRDTLNAGWNLQGNDQQQMAGWELHWASPLGNFSLDNAFSASEWVYRDWALQGNYLLVLHSFPKAPVPSFHLRYQGRNFLPESDEAPLQWDGAFSVQQRINTELSVQGSVNYSQAWDAAEPVWQINGILQVPFHERATLSVRFHSRIEAGSETQNSLSLLLQLQNPERNSSLSYRQDITSVDYLLNWQQRFPQTGLNLSASMSGEDQLQSQLSWQGNRVETSATLQMNDPYGSSPNPAGSFRYGTALVYAGGKAALSRPVQDSFVIILPRYGLTGRPVGVNPQPRYEAKSDILGPAVLSNISSYQYRDIHTELLDYREDDILQSGATDFRIFPTLHSGFLLYLGQPPRITLSCTLLDPLGETLSWQAGKILQAGEEQWFFTDQEGLALIYDLVPGVYEIKFPGYQAVTVDLTEEKSDHSITIQLKGDQP